MDPVLWFQSLPLITQGWLGCALAVNIATTMDIINPSELLFSTTIKILRDDLELWRIITSFCYCGGPLNEFHAIILLYTLSMHSSHYEKNPYPTSTNRRADYAFCLLICIILILISYLIVDYYQNSIMNTIISFVGRSNQSAIRNIRFALLYKGGGAGRLLKPYFTKNLVTAIMYLWSRRNPHQNININFIPIPGLYLPFAHLGIDLALGNRINEVIHGIFVGHCYYWCADIFPTITGGRHLLRTPEILIMLVGGNNDPEIMSDGPESDYARRRRRPQPVANRRRQGGRGGNPNNNNNWGRVLHEDRATSAHLAAKLGNLNQLQQIASSNQIRDRRSLFARDRNDWQPIHEAVRGGHVDVVKFLLDDALIAIMLNNNNSNEGDGVGDADDNSSTATNIVRQVGMYLQESRTNNGNGPNPIELAESTHGRDHPLTLYLQRKMEEYQHLQQEQEPHHEQPRLDSNDDDTDGIFGRNDGNINNNTEPQ